MLDATLLARIQFAFTVSFHIIFTTLSIGLALFLAIVEGLWLRTRDVVYLQIYPRTSHTVQELQRKAL